MTVGFELEPVDQFRSGGCGLVQVGVGYESGQEPGAVTPSTEGGELGGVGFGELSGFQVVG